MSNDQNQGKEAISRDPLPVEGEKLLPCPFCGRHAIFVGNGVNSKVFGVVHCVMQDCIGYHWPDGEYGGYTHATTKAEAIAAWNTRATPPAEPTTHADEGALREADALVERIMAMSDEEIMRHTTPSEAEALASIARQAIKIATLQKRLQRTREASGPLLREIDRLEREYGFDRPASQYQPLMIALGDLVAFRAALKELGGGA